MAVITFPDIVPKEWTMYPFNVMYASGSGETLSGQIVETLGAPWVIQATYNPFNPTQADVMQSFIDQMQGLKNVTQIGNVLRKAPRGTVSGATLVNGANQTGTSISIKGMTSGQTWLRGDMFGIGNSLYRVTVPGTANGSGIATVGFVPPILVAPADEAVVNYSYPKAYFRLRGNINPLGRAVPLPRDWLNGITLEFIEVLP